MLPKI
ncbi:Protein of unknown function [Bacillus toyonensis]